MLRCEISVLSRNYSLHRINFRTFKTLKEKSCFKRTDVLQKPQSKLSSAYSFLWKRYSLPCSWYRDYFLSCRLISPSDGAILTAYPFNICDVIWLVERGMIDMSLFKSKCDWLKVMWLTCYKLWKWTRWTYPNLTWREINKFRFFRELIYTRNANSKPQNPLLPLEICTKAVLLSSVLLIPEKTVFEP